MNKPCTLPPPGWSCSRDKGHDGPCAASPTCPKCHGTKNSPDLGGNNTCFHCGDCGYVHCVETCPDPTTPPSPDKWDALRRAAEHAMKGTWYSDKFIKILGLDKEIYSAETARTNFIALASPAAILELLSELRGMERGGECQLEMELRKLMWLSHGHFGMYGDDGEMQCSECAKYGCWDYKNAPLSETRSAYQAALLERMQKATLSVAEGPEISGLNISVPCPKCGTIVHGAKVELTVKPVTEGVDDLYFIQDTRNYVGNSVMWWRPNGNGYTSDIDQAWKVSKEKAEMMHACRPTDVAWPCAAIEAKAQRNFDMQLLRDIKQSGVDGREK